MGDVQCYHYAASAFRRDLNGPHDVIYSGGVCTPSTKLFEWFEEPRLASFFERPKLGDLVIWKGKCHVAVGTGDQDWVIQSGYNVQKRDEAERLKHLIQLARAGFFNTKASRERSEYEIWSVAPKMGPSTVRLELLRIAQSGGASNVVQVCALRPEARDFIDPHGPLGGFMVCVMPARPSFISAKSQSPFGTSLRP